MTPPVTDRLGEIACPTTIIVGAEDEPFLKPSEIMAKRIPGARHVAIEGGAHCPQVGAPEAWIAAVDAHLDWARSVTR
jgi:2-succinyl-6-hydroxy-2,4-cyclohexadiene-1-carboxylate synthase